MRFRGAAALTAGCLLAAGCTAGTGPGPFGTGGDPAVVCTPVSPGAVLTYGAEEFSNSSSDTAVIGNLALAKPRHLELLAAYAVPVTGTELYGESIGFPPAPDLAPGVGWAHRQRADGAEIPPSRHGDVTNLLVVVKPTGPVGSAVGISVNYTAGGRQYYLQTATNIVVTNGGRCGTDLPYSK
jgi:hypothetical protein